MRIILISFVVLWAAAANDIAAAEAARRPLPPPHPSVQAMLAAKQGARSALPPAPRVTPSKSQLEVTLPREPELDWDDTPVTALPLPTASSPGAASRCPGGNCPAPTESPRSRRSYRFFRIR